MESKANGATQTSKRLQRGVLFVHTENIFLKAEGIKKCFIVQENQTQVLQNSCGKDLRSGKFLTKNLSSKSPFITLDKCLFKPASAEMSFGTIKKTNRKPRGKSDCNELFFKNN